MSGAAAADWTSKGVPNSVMLSKPFVGQGAGLRAKEIARLTWWMTKDAQGEIGRVICLQDSAS